jgi:hypothetical protein
MASHLVRSTYITKGDFGHEDRGKGRKGWKSGGAIRA